jgi:hypothetical protein
MAGEQVELLKSKLYGPGGLGAVNVNVFPGTSRDVSAEQAAREISGALARMDAGDFEEVDMSKVED